MSDIYEFVGGPADGAELRCDAINATKTVYLIYAPDRPGSITGFWGNPCYKPGYSKYTLAYANTYIHDTIGDNDIESSEQVHGELTAF